MNQRQNITISSTNSTYDRAQTNKINKIRKNRRCGLLCATVSGPSLSVR